MCYDKNKRGKFTLLVTFLWEAIFILHYYQTRYIKMVSDAMTMNTVNSCERLPEKPQFATRSTSMIQTRGNA